jgi:SnoaL-like domain
MTRAEFISLLTRLGNAWSAGDAEAAAGCFADAVDYADPIRYRFRARAELVPFFEPPPGGHSTVWHRILFDEAAQAGAVEYTYTGHHRYHGAAILQVDPGGLIAAWREWQHVDDARDWDAFLADPG